MLFFYKVSESPHILNGLKKKMAKNQHTQKENGKEWGKVAASILMLLPLQQATKSACNNQNRDCQRASLCCSLLLCGMLTFNFQKIV